jgi:hypothetical protein
LFWHTYTFQMVFAPSIRKNDPEHNAMVHRAMKKVVAVTAEHGWGDYKAARSTRTMSRTRTASTTTSCAAFMSG